MGNMMIKAVANILEYTVGNLPSHTRYVYGINHTKKEIVRVPYRFPNRSNGLFKMFFAFPYMAFTDLVKNGTHILNNSGWKKDEMKVAKAGEDFHEQEYLDQGYTLKYDV